MPCPTGSTEALDRESDAKQQADESQRAERAGNDVEAAEGRSRKRGLGQPTHPGSGNDRGAETTDAPVASAPGAELRQAAENEP